MRGLPESPTETPMLRQWLSRARTLPEELANRYSRMSRRSKGIMFGVVIVNICILIGIIIITPRRIGQAINAFAVRVRDMGPLGVLLCMGLVIVTSHPPLFGFSASMTLVGFAYGVWPGFLIAVISSMLGAGIAFVSVRRFFPHLIKPNRKWDAFGRVMREKGTILVCMIRYCPIPWAVGNGLFASIESVKLWQFMLANLSIQPRLLIPVFIGSRLTSLSSDEPSSDPAHFWLNIVSIVLSMCISTSTGIWIYSLTRKQMKKYEDAHPDALGAEEGLEEGLLEAAWAEEFGREQERGDGESLVDSQRPKGGRVESYGFGQILRGDSYASGHGSGNNSSAGSREGSGTASEVVSPLPQREEVVTAGRGQVMGMTRRSSSGQSAVGPRDSTGPE